MDALRGNTNRPIATLDDELEGLRKRIHFLEQHNQYFFRCESSWCHPTETDNPALVFGIEGGFC